MVVLGSGFPNVHMFRDVQKLTEKWTTSLEQHESAFIYFSVINQQNCQHLARHPVPTKLVEHWQKNTKRPPGKPLNEFIDAPLVRDSTKCHPKNIFYSRNDVLLSIREEN